LSDPEIKCRRCGTAMVDGEALAPTFINRLPDFPGQTDLRGQTLNPGPGEVVAVKKCPSCGHSFISGDAP